MCFQKKNSSIRELVISSYKTNVRSVKTAVKKQSYSSCNRFSSKVLICRNKINNPARENHDIQKLYHNGVVDKVTSCTRMSLTKPNKHKINTETALTNFMLYYNHPNLKSLQKDLYHSFSKLSPSKLVFPLSFGSSRPFSQSFALQPRKLEWF